MISRNSRALLMHALAMAAQSTSIGPSPVAGTYPWRHLEATRRKRNLKRKRRLKQFSR